MIYAYVRVSTDKQMLENQEFEIKNFCKKEKISIDKWEMETISGTKNFEKRKLGKLLKRLKKRRYSDMFGNITAWTQFIADYDNSEYLPQ